MWDRHRTGESKGGFDLRNPKPETRNGQLKLASINETRNPKPESRNPKPTAKVGFRRRNPKPETDSESWFQATKPETRNRKLVSSDETPNPKPETDSKSGFQSTKPETRNPKPETDSESWFQATKPETRNPKPTAKVGFNRRNPKPETRNPKPTAKVGFNRRNPKPETDSESWFQSTKPETRNPKPTRIRLLGGSPDRNSHVQFWRVDCIPVAALHPRSAKECSKGRQNPSRTEPVFLKLSEKARFHSFTLLMQWWFRGFSPQLSSSMVSFAPWTLHRFHRYQLPRVASRGLSCRDGCHPTQQAGKRWKVWRCWKKGVCIVGRSFTRWCSWAAVWICFRSKHAHWLQWKQVKIFKVREDMWRPKQSPIYPICKSVKISNCIWLWISQIATWSKPKPSKSRHWSRPHHWGAMRRWSRGPWYVCYVV